MTYFANFISNTVKKKSYIIYEHFIMRSEDEVKIVFLTKRVFWIAIKLWNFI